MPGPLANRPTARELLCSFALPCRLSAAHCDTHCTAVARHYITVLTYVIYLCSALTTVPIPPLRLQGVSLFVRTSCHYMPPSLIPFGKTPDIRIYHLDLTTSPPSRTCTSVEITYISNAALAASKSRLRIFACHAKLSDTKPEVYLTVPRQETGLLR
jgi:hypothetical protein